MFLLEIISATAIPQESQFVSNYCCVLTCISYILVVYFFSQIYFASFHKYIGFGLAKKVSEYLYAKVRKNLSDTGKNFAGLNKFLSDMSSSPTSCID